jgi:hypothetical protein
MYFLNGWGHTDVFLEWGVFGRPSAASSCTTIVFLERLGHTDCISWLGVFGRPKAASPCNTIVFVGRGGRLTYIHIKK